MAVRFGVIFIIDDDDKTKELLRSILERKKKCNFIWFIEIVIGPIESLFIVYENEPSATFNLKNYLLVLAKHTYNKKICYCENKQDKNTHNIKNIKLLSTRRHDFGKDLDSIDVELSNPNTFVQSLLKLGSFLHGKTIESFDNPTNYPPITLPPLQTTVEIEEHRKNTTFDQNYNSLYYRQSSTQNIKINEIANDLESGNAITTAINNSFINEINLTSAIIDKIEYHFRDNTFHFIFDVSNKFLSGKSRLTIEVPRVKLENIKLPDMKEIYVNQWYINIFINTLIFSINEGFYILTGV
ncbi:hypothetical protein MPG59_07160 [Helicobacter pylori]|uniref:hypothetical protein n=1 Tax=Helicobacter pylori TaxID=210 RepID=UPI001FF1442C|nr:hypothetical protein [Helicobacter pylori]MCJ8496539.1 hypothetical protein [Helicobacter pylori]